MLQVQTDVYSAQAHFVAKKIAEAWDRHPSDKARTKAAVEELKRWDGKMDRGSGAAMLAAIAYERIRKAIAESAAPGKGEEWERSFFAPEVVEHLLADRPDGWFKDYDTMLIDAVEGALTEGEKFYGSKVSLWDYGQYNELRFDHPVASKLPLIGKYFSIGPAPMGGSPTTVKQTSARLGPAMRMTVDLGALDHSLANITFGQSGHWLSSHARDQWDAYSAGTSFPMRFEQLGPVQVLRVTPR